MGLRKEDGVHATEERRNRAFWGVPTKPNPRRARGRAPWLKSLEGLKSRSGPTLRVAPFAVGCYSDGSVDFS